MDDTSIPTGEIRMAQGAMDLRKARVGAGIKEADNGLGYDHNYVLRGPLEEGLQLVARVSEPTSGRWMLVKTDQPGDARRSSGGVGWHRFELFFMDSRGLSMVWAC